MLEKVSGGDYGLIKNYLQFRTYDDLDGCTTDSVYDDFVDYTLRSGDDPYVLPRRTFKLLLTNDYGFKTKVVRYKGRATRIYVKE